MDPADRACVLHEVLRLRHGWSVWRDDDSRNLAGPTRVTPSPCRHLSPTNVADDGAVPLWIAPLFAIVPEARVTIVSTTARDRTIRLGQQVAVHRSKDDVIANSPCCPQVGVADRFLGKAAAMLTTVISRSRKRRELHERRSGMPGAIFEWSWMTSTSRFSRASGER